MFLANEGKVSKNLNQIAQTVQDCTLRNKGASSQKFSGEMPPLFYYRSLLSREL